MTAPGRTSALDESPPQLGGRIGIQAFSRPYSPFHDIYQRYYQEGLRAYADTGAARVEITSLSPFPRLLRGLRTAQDRNFATRWHVPRANALLDSIGRRLEGASQTPSGFFEPTVGQYLFSDPVGGLQRVCIDAGDSHEIPSDNLCEWSDVYFKTNFWGDRAYPGNVKPMVNADPLMLERLPGLRSSRSAPKELDLSFIVRVWGGDDGIAGIEHNLRLLTAMKRARCTKRLLAVVPAGDVEKTLRYLERAGIPATTRGISPRELWEVTAASRLNVFRLGMHYCIPWRMTGSLACGSCAVLDRPPLSRWPEALHEGVNYLSLGTMVAPDAPLASDDQYDEIPDRIEAWLQKPELLREIEDANARYFDGFLAPSQVGRQIVEAVESSRAAT